MARGRQLSQLLDQLQAEAGMSLLPASATSSKDHRVQVLNRVQDRLYKAFDWDFAFIKRDVPTVIGDRYLNLPADIELERVNYVRISNGTAGNDAIAALVAKVDLLGGVLGLMRRPKYVHQWRAETGFVAHTSHILISVQANGHRLWSTQSATLVSLIVIGFGD